MIVQVVILKSQMILCSKTRIILIRYLWTSHIEMIRIREMYIAKIRNKRNKTRNTNDMQYKSDHSL